MNIDSFVDSLRRVIARQGKPEIIHSDNDTNFTSGGKEIREAMLQWNQKNIHECLVQQNVQWILSSNGISHGRGIGTSNKISQKNNRCFIEETNHGG